MTPTSTHDPADLAWQTYVNLIRDELQADAVLLVVIRDRNGRSGAAISAYQRGAADLAHCLRKRVWEICAQLDQSAADYARAQALNVTDLRSETTACT
jgi:hypothetical protein